MGRVKYQEKGCSATTFFIFLEVSTAKNAAAGECLLGSEP